MQMACSNPLCDELVEVTAEQKRALLVDNFLKYGKLSLVYCCKGCQEEHQRELSRSKFFLAGDLKNHESALIREGCSVKKREKVHEDSGIVTLDQFF